MTDTTMTMTTPEGRMTIAAMNFLSHRMPSEFMDQDIDPSTWNFMLYEFMEIHGERALQALAGFYVWCVDHLQGEKQHRAIVSTLAHDVFGRNKECMLPRSDSYHEFWVEESTKRGWN